MSAVLHWWSKHAEVLNDKFQLDVLDVAFGTGQMKGI